MHKNIYGKAHGCHVVTNVHVINITITFFGKNAHFLGNADRGKAKECDNHAELRNLRKRLDKQKKACIMRRWGETTEGGREKEHYSLSERKRTAKEVVGLRRNVSLKG